MNNVTFNKAFRSEYETIVVRGKLLYIQKIPDGILYKFEDKCVFISQIDDNERDQINKYVLNENHLIYDLQVNSNIKAKFDHENIEWNINSLKEELDINIDYTMVSYSGALVLNGVCRYSNDIDLMISPYIALDIEDKFNIFRSIAPMGNTSKQTWNDIDMFAFDGERVREKNKTDSGIGYESLESLIDSYHERGREKDLEKIKLIEEYLKK